MVIKITKHVTEAKEDSFAKLLGQFGRYQFLVFGTVSLVKLTSGWVQLAILFLTPNILFRCNNAPNVTDIKNDTCYTDCERYEYDSTPFTQTIVSEWDLICDKQWLASFTQTVLQLGILIGSIVFGFLSDRCGRKNTFLTAVMLVVVIGFGIPFSPNYEVFTALRLFLGFSTAGTMVVSFVIIMETVGPKYREVTGCLFQIPFIIGHMTLPLFAYYYRRWNTYTLALAVPTLIYFGYIFILTESPRWLVSVGRIDEATKIVKKAALINNMPTEKIEETLKQVSEEISSQSTNLKPNYNDLFKGSLRLKTVCCCILWLIMGVSYFGFNQYISQTSPDPFISVALAGLIQIPSNFLSIYLIKKFGRRLTTSVFFGLGGVSVIILHFVPKIFAATLTLSCLGVSCGSIVATTLYIFTSELYPTVVRNMGLGASSTLMRIGSMIAPFVSNTAHTVPWLPTVIFGVTPLGAAALCFLLPETKGRNLQDSIEDVASD